MEGIDEKYRTMDNDEEHTTERTDDHECMMMMMIPLVERLSRN